MPRKELIVAAMCSQRPPMSVKEQVRGYLDERLVDHIKPHVTSLVEHLKAYAYDGKITVCELRAAVCMVEESRQALQDSVTQMFLHVDTGRVVERGESFVIIECIDGERCTAPTDFYDALCKLKGVTA